MIFLGTNACFQLYYHMRGRDMGDLDVVIEDKFGSKIVRWSTWRHISPGWNQGVVPLPPSAEMV